ncbi:MAG: type II toxin-antitoxin system HicB family antitoxin [Verrucomicrobiota bacterium]
MKEIVFRVEKCKDSRRLVASWDALSGKGGITTQGRDLKELQEMIKDAVRCHFERGKRPRSVRLHFINDPVLATA